MAREQEPLRPNRGIISGDKSFERIFAPPRLTSRLLHTKKGKSDGTSDLAHNFIASVAVFMAKEENAKRRHVNNATGNK